MHTSKSNSKKLESHWLNYAMSKERSTLLKGWRGIEVPRCLSFEVTQLTNWVKQLTKRTRVWFCYSASAVSEWPLMLNKSYLSTEQQNLSGKAFLIYLCTSCSVLNLISSYILWRVCALGISHSYFGRDWLLACHFPIIHNRLLLVCMFVLRYALL